MEYQLFHNLEEITTLGKSMEEIKEELYALWIACFDDTKPYTDFYFKWKVKENQILTLYKDGKPSSMLHLNPYTIKNRGERLPANYIVGVATKKEDRRQGLMKELIETALNQMYKEKIPFTYLMPAAEAIYLPFDFRIVYKQENWDELLKSSMESRNFNKKEETFNNTDEKADEEADKEADKEEPTFKENTYKVLEITLKDTDKINELLEFTSHILDRDYTIHTERTEYYYQRLLYEMESTGGGLLLCYKGEEAIGYTSYMAEGGIHLTECIYKKEEKKEIFRAFAKYFQKESTNSIADRNGFEPAIMTRIVNWQAFAEKITSREEVSLIIEVKDPIVKENNGVYKLILNKSSCKAEKINKTLEKTGFDLEDSSVKAQFNAQTEGINTTYNNLSDKTMADTPDISADISIDIADLTKLFFGCLREEEILPFLDSEKQKEILTKLDKLLIYNNLFINIRLIT